MWVGYGLCVCVEAVPVPVGWCVVGSLGWYPVEPGGHVGDGEGGVELWGLVL